ncbi:PaaX family transcriptional regulator [Polaromonas sp. P1-6]|nr:PaaX family transcriptional regulator [Polaromonas sp. P1-6]
MQPQLVLDLLVSNEGKPVDAKHLHLAGELFGLSPSTIRVSLNRLVEQEKIQRAARGRYADRYRELPLSKILGQWRTRSEMRTTWKGIWVGVLDGDVLRSDKTAWRRHMLAVSLHGLMRLRSGLLVRPDNLTGGVAGARQRLQTLGLAPSAVVCQIAHLSPQDRTEACHLWNVRELDAQDQVLLDKLKRSLLRIEAIEPRLAVRESLLLGRTAIAQLMRDPLLPEQLRPSGTRRRLVSLATQYQEVARKTWRMWLREGA